MVLFSGDCLNPSLLSTITSGWQMVRHSGRHLGLVSHGDLAYSLTGLDDRPQWRYPARD